MYNYAAFSLKVEEHKRRIAEKLKEMENVHEGEDEPTLGFDVSQVREDRSMEGTPCRQSTPSLESTGKRVFLRMWVFHLSTLLSDSEENLVEHKHSCAHLVSAKRFDHEGFIICYAVCTKCVNAQQDLF